MAHKSQQEEYKTRIDVIVDRRIVSFKKNVRYSDMLKIIYRMFKIIGYTKLELSVITVIETTYRKPITSSKLTVG